jgi:WD40 repeat protein
VAVTGGDQLHVPLFPIDAGDGVVALWRASEDGLVLAGDPQPAHSRRTGGVRAVAVGQLGGQLVAVTGGADGTVALWQASDGRLVHAPTIRIPVGSPLVSITLLSPTAVLAWCEDGVLTAAIRIPQV